MADNVKVVISHHQEIGGKEYQPGDEETLSSPLARVLVRRGAVQYKSEKDAAKTQPAQAANTKGASK